jgi:hypothetical protein
VKTRSAQEEMGGQLVEQQVFDSKPTPATLGRVYVLSLGQVMETRSASG